MAHLRRALIVLRRPPTQHQRGEQQASLKELTAGILIWFLVYLRRLVGNIGPRILHQQLAGRDGEDGERGQVIDALMIKKKKKKD